MLSAAGNVIFSNADGIIFLWSISLLTFLWSFAHKKEGIDGYMSKFVSLYGF